MVKLLILNKMEINNKTKLIRKHNKPSEHYTIKTFNGSQIKKTYRYHLDYYYNYY